MAKPLARQSLHTDPSRVWAGLDTDHQRRALQLLAQMALHFLTGHAAPPFKEEPLCVRHEAQRENGWKILLSVQADGKSLGRSAGWMQVRGETAGPERYWCGAM
jgi:hypothetical protein